MRKTVPLHLDVGVAAALLGGVSRRWILDHIKKGDLDGYKLAGNKVVVTAESLNRLLDRRRITGEQDPAATT